MKSLRPRPTQPGLCKVKICPRLPGALHFAEATFGFLCPKLAGKGRAAPACLRPRALGAREGTQTRATLGSYSCSLLPQLPFPSIIRSGPRTSRPLIGQLSGGVHADWWRRADRALLRPPPRRVSAWRRPRSSQPHCARVVPRRLRCSRVACPDAKSNE